MSDNWETPKDEAHAAASPCSRHARAAAGDRRLHTHYWSLQVEQAQVKDSPGVFPGVILSKKNDSIQTYSSPAYEKVYQLISQCPSSSLQYG